MNTLVNVSSAAVWNKVMDQHPGEGGAFSSRLTPPGGDVRTSIKREFLRREEAGSGVKGTPCSSLCQ